MGKIKHKLLLLFLLLSFFAIGASFVLAQEKPLEIQYPQIPGAETPANTKVLLPQYVKYIFNFSVWLAELIAFGTIIYGGVRYLTSAGSATAMSEARKQIFAGILGLIILFSSYIILSALNPQLLFLKIPLPELGEVPPTVAPTPPSGLQTLTATEIPIATMVNGANYSDHKGALDERRMESIKKFLDEIKKVSFKIIDLSKDLQALAATCTGEKTTCSLKGDCICMGDPCKPNRAKMNLLRLEVNTLNMAIDVFIKKDQKIRDYMNDYPSWALLEKTVTPAENEFCGYWLAVANSYVYYSPAQRTAYMKNCLAGLLDAPPVLSEDTRKLFNEMAVIEEDGGELEQIRDEMAKDLQLLTAGEKAMRECPRVGDDRKAYDLFPANEFSVYKEDLVSGVKLVKEIKTERTWPEIVARDDPGTFYCAEGLNEVPFINEEISAQEVETELQKTREGQTTQKVTCETEIPLGKTIDDAVALAQKIMDAINELVNSTSNQIDSAYTITLLTDWQSNHCGATKYVAIPYNNYRYCPNLECFATRDDRKPCPQRPTCPLVEIEDALKAVEQNLACFLKKEGQEGVEYAGESFQCCQNPYNITACRKTEGPYGRLLKYYEESVTINKQLAEDRGNLAVCKNTAGERARMLLGENISEKGVITCLMAKSTCTNLEEAYECYGNDDPNAHSNYFCIKAEAQQ